MRNRLIQVGNALTGFVAVTLVVFGAYRFQFGVGTVEETVALAFLAVTVVASYRSLVVHSGPTVNAVGNIALFTAAVASYGGGLNFGIDPAFTVGQALFAIAVAFFFIQRL